MIEQHDPFEAPWSPFAARDEHPHEIRRGDRVVATAYFRKWSARERLAFEDALALRALTTTEDGGKSVRIGLLRRLRLSLTLVRVDGFGEVDLGRPDGPEPFNPRDEAHLDALDADTFDELARVARDVQPVAELDRPGKGSETSDAADPEDGDDEDPLPAA